MRLRPTQQKKLAEAKQYLRDATTAKSRSYWTAEIKRIAAWSKNVGRKGWTS